jgi:hypothetical protein
MACTLHSLGIEELEGQAAELERQEESSRLQRQQLYKSMVAQITGRRIEDVSVPYGRPHEIQQAIEKRKLLHEEQLMEKDELGRRILAYRREKEELLDTVWLATSGKQIRQLWTAAIRSPGNRARIRPVVTPRPLSAAWSRGGFNYCLFPSSIHRANRHRTLPLTAYKH